MRQGLAQLLSHEGDLTVCGQAANAAHGLSSARSLEPDLAIVDLSLKGSSGLDLVKDFRAFLPKMPVLVLSMHDETIYAERVLLAGARGYVMKQEAMEDIIAAVRRLLAGGFYVSESMNARMVHKFAAGGNGAATDQSIVDSLSDRELQVLQHLGKGKSTRLIAGELCISIKTVETHRAHLKEKLQLSNAPELVHFAIEWVHGQEAS